MRGKRYRNIDAFVSHKKLRGWKTPQPERQLNWKETEALHGKAVELAGKLREGTPEEKEHYRNQYDLVEKELTAVCLSWTKNGMKPLPVRYYDWLEDHVKKPDLVVMWVIGLVLIYAGSSRRIEPLLLFPIGLGVLLAFIFGTSSLQKLLSLSQELWYRALVWEFREWRFDMARQWVEGESKALEEEMDTLSNQIDKATDDMLEAREKGEKDTSLEEMNREIDDMLKRSERLGKRWLALWNRWETWVDDDYKQRALLHRWVEWRGLRLSVKDIDYRLRRRVPIW